MTSDEKINELWRQIIRLDAEYELAERERNMIIADWGLSSPEAADAAQYLSALRMRLIQMDKEYAGLLKQAGWINESEK